MNYFDLHCDTLFRLINENTDFADSRLAVNSHYIGLFENYYQSFAVWTPNSVANKSDFVNKCINRFKSEIKPLKSETFNPILSIEGADFISDDLEMVYHLKDECVFSVSLTWNDENSFAGGANSDADLKPLGRDLIRLLNENGIFCDVSHLNRKSFYKVIDYADNVIATHTYIDELNHNNRNLTLEQMYLIKEKNGIIGLCLYPEFLGTENVNEALYNGLAFCLENDFSNNIAFGSDFDGAQIPIKLNSIPDLYRYLQCRGIDNNTLDLFFFINAFNQFKCFDK